MFQSKTTAKEDFKKLLVTTIGDIKTFYSQLKYPSFINSVVMLDCLMDSYKEDPEFKAKADRINLEKDIDLLNVQMEQLIGDGSSSLSEKQKEYFIQWFKLLVSLATRTVFAGRMTNVDIDLADVMNEWNQMTKIQEKDLEDGVVKKVLTDIYEEPEYEAVV